MTNGQRLVRRVRKSVRVAATWTLVPGLVVAIGALLTFGGHYNPALVWGLVAAWLGLGLASLRVYRIGIGGYCHTERATCLMSGPMGLLLTGLDKASAWWHTDPDAVMTTDDWAALFEG